MTYSVVVDAKTRALEQSLVAASPCSSSARRQISPVVDGVDEADDTVEGDSVVVG